MIPASQKVMISAEAEGKEREVLAVVLPLLPPRARAVVVLPRCFVTSVFVGRDDGDGGSGT